MAISESGQLEAELIDPVTAEVIRSAMETICFEMATYVSGIRRTRLPSRSRGGGYGSRFRNG